MTLAQLAQGVSPTLAPPSGQTARSTLGPRRPPRRWRRPFPTRPRGCAGRRPCRSGNASDRASALFRGLPACVRSTPPVPPMASGHGLLRRAQPLRALATVVRFRSAWLSRVHLPAPLRSTVVTRFRATMGALTSVGRLFGPVYRVMNSVLSRQLSHRPHVTFPVCQLQPRLDRRHSQPDMSRQGCRSRHKAAGFAFFQQARPVQTPNPSSLSFRPTGPLRVALHLVSRRRSFPSLPIPIPASGYDFHVLISCI